MWQGATRKFVRAEYGACEFVNLDLEAGLWVLHPDSLNTRMSQLQPKTGAAPMLAGCVVAYDGVPVLLPMVCRRAGEVTCQVPGCGKTMPFRQMRIHIAFHLQTSDLQAP